MDKFEPFVPLEFLKKRKTEKGKDEKELLKEEIEELRKLNEELNRELQQLKFSLTSYQKRFEEEKKHLLQKLESLTLEKQQLEAQLLKLQKLYEEEKEKNTRFEEFLKSLSEHLNKNLQKLENTFARISAEVLTETLKGILSKEKIHREEDLKRIFSSILREKIFSGEISIRANPQDIPLFEELLKDKDIKLFELVPDPKLSRGEFEIETDKFFVERKYDQLVEEFVEELLREKLKEVHSEGGEEQTGH